MKLSDTNLTSSKSSMNDSSTKSLQRLLSTSSSSSKTSTTRRQHFSSINNDFLVQRTSSTFSVPLLIETMNQFFQTILLMEEEIMLPLRLKDMPVEELVSDNTIQPNNWHEIYTFLLNMRNQLLCTYPFADDDHNEKKQERKYSNDDEGIIISNNDNNQFSSASSTVSSEDYEQIPSSIHSIRDDLKYHYYGLFRSLDQLTSLANRVIEKYREECIC